MLKFFAPITLLLIATAPAHTQESGTYAQVGAKTLTLPAIADFVEASTISPNVVKVMEGFVPQSNRLLAAYLSADDTALLAAGQEPSMNNYVMIQTVRSVESMTLSSAQFDEIKSYLKNNLSFDEGFSDQMQEKLDGEVDATQARNDFLHSLDMSKPTLVAFGDETDNSMAFTMMMDVQAQTDAGLRAYKMVYETVAMNAAGKVLYIYVYDKFGEGNEVDNVQAIGQSIKTGIISANR